MVRQDGGVGLGNGHGLEGVGRRGYNCESPPVIQRETVLRSAYFILLFLDVPLEAMPAVTGKVHFQTFHALKARRAANKFS